MGDLTAPQRRVSPGRLPLWLRRLRNGISPLTLAAQVSGRAHYLRFAGVRLRAPEPTNAWGLMLEIASGEYEFAGMGPRRGDRVIDLGGNIGIFSLWCIRRGARVISYEPHPVTYEVLSGNLARCPGGQARHAAIVGRAPESGVVDLWVHDERPSRNTLTGVEVASGEPLRNKLGVPALSLTAVLEDPCDLLKIDVEGAEFEIARHTAPETLSGLDRIVMEVHPAVGEPGEIDQWLDSAGYRRVWVSSGTEDQVAQDTLIVFASRPAIDSNRLS